MPSLINNIELGKNEEKNEGPSKKKKKRENPKNLKVVPSRQYPDMDIYIYIYIYHQIYICRYIYTL